MVSLQTVILCISIALFGLALQGSEAKSHSFTIPPGQDISNLDLSKLDLGSNVDKSQIKLKQYSIPGSTHTHRYKLPGKNVTHTYHYKKPGMNVTHTHYYKKPGMNVTHTYQYKKPGMTDVHHYRYKKPGHPNVHTYRYKKPGHTVKHSYKYKKPGTTNTHTYQYKKPGMTNTHTYHYKNKKPVTGVYYIINVIYNYFAVGGRLTGIPPIDLTLLRYYLAQGPKNFCPKQ